MLTAEEYKSMVSTGKVLVDVRGLTFCMPCQAAEPVVEQFSEEYKGKLLVVPVDFEGNELFVSDVLGAQSLPTFIFYDEGREVKRLVGFRKDVLVDEVRSFVGNA